MADNSRFRSGILDIPSVELPDVGFQSSIGQVGSWRDDFTDTSRFMQGAASGRNPNMFSRGWDNFKELFRNYGNDTRLSPEQLNAQASAQLQRWQGIGAGLQGIAGIGNMYLGARHLSETKRQNAFERQAFERNYAASRQQYNTQLEARKRRALQRGGDYSDSKVDEYMRKHRIN